jgi:hypothetical protein
MPNFLVVGVQRCGTTWLDSALRGHPQIFLPATKQSYFFDRTFERGTDWYQTRFTGAGPQHDAVGEVASGYSLPHAIPRLAEHLPDARLVMALRNPVDRANSYYQGRSVKYGWKSFEEAVEAEPDILERGRYIEQIELLLQHYDRDRVLVVFYDDLIRNDRDYLRSILRFLNVDEHWQSPLLGKMVQTAAFPRVRKILRRLHMDGAIKMVSKSPLGDPIRRYLKASSNRRYPSLAPDVRQGLVDYYAPLNERLGAFCGRDLSHWNR